MRRSVLVTAGIVPLVVTLLCGQQAPPDLQKAGEQAYFFAYPMVLLDVWRGARGESAPPNTLQHQQEFPSDKSRSGAAPNADTLYSGAWLDLSKEPVLLHVPDTRGRYYLMQLVDAWGETVLAPGKRTTGTAQRWFALVGPRWSGTLPEGASRIDFPTNTAFLLGRIQTNTAADYANVHALQRQFRLMPLSRYPAAQEVSPPASRKREISTPLHETVAAMTTAEFFTLFAKLLPGNPPHAADSRMVIQLAALRIEPGKPFSADRLDPSFEHGVSSAKEMLGNPAKRKAFLGRTGTTGWMATFTRQGRYGVDYARRAVVARVGLIATLPEDNVYMSCLQDGSGRSLEGTRNYIMHFNKANLPPVRAFWSVTLYDAGNFVANPLNRYAIGDRDALKFNADGSLDLFIQHESPGAAHEGNWLPSPAGPFDLLMRLYWPEESVLNGEWIPPAVTERGRVAGTHRHPEAPSSQGVDQTELRASRTIDSVTGEQSSAATGLERRPVLCRVRMARGKDRRPQDQRRDLPGVCRHAQGHSPARAQRLNSSNSSQSSSRRSSVWTLSMRGREQHRPPHLGNPEQRVFGRR